MKKEENEKIRNIQNILFICGCTGSGKSSISINLAKYLNSEIINSDSLQLYKGLNIATAKVTPLEMEGIPHHLLDIFEPYENLNVKIFQNMTINLIERLLNQSISPIIVGGTHYYMESVLFQKINSSSSSSSSSSTCLSTLTTTNSITTSSLNDDNNNTQHITSNEESKNNDTNNEIILDEEKSLHTQLQEIDPELASTLHPNDTRRIKKLLLQLNRENVPSLLDTYDSLISRYDNSILIVVDCEMNILKDRLRKRVEQMIEKGLIDEVLNFHKQYSVLTNNNENEISVEEKNEDESTGVTIAIGYKEFLPYILEYEKQQQNNQNNLEVLDQLKAECIEKVIISTIHYAKRQKTWINNSLIPKCQRLNIPVITLDLFQQQNQNQSNNLRSSTVYSIEELIERLNNLSNTENDYMLNESDSRNSVDHIWKKRKIFNCEVCTNQSFQGYEQYQIHLKSKKHKKRCSSMKKRIKCSTFDE